ncbi:hypothetical protein, partial, partial [Parasitella parasitica]
MSGRRRLTQNINALIDSNAASSSVLLPQLPFQDINTLNSDYAYAQAVEAAAKKTAEKAIEQFRPKNTTKAYMNRREEFMEWCHTHYLPNPLNEIPDDRKLC